MDNFTNKNDENMIAGRNAVLEALRAKREIDCIMVERGKLSGSISVILAKAKERDIPIKEVAPAKLNSLCENTSHQGVIAIAAVHEYCSVDDILSAAEEANQPPFLIICDEIEDPHNLGAIIRTAEACGVHGIIIPKRRSVGMSFAVAKSASGALEYMRVARVTNLVSTINELKSKGIWVYGADMDGQNWCEQNFSGPVALVIGSEGNGIGRLVRENCDVIVSLPMSGKISSLNASVAAGVLMYEVSRQRLGIKSVQPKGLV